MKINKDFHHQKINQKMKKMRRSEEIVNLNEIDWQIKEIFSEVALSSLFAEIDEKDAKKI